MRQSTSLPQTHARSGLKAGSCVLPAAVTTGASIRANRSSAAQRSTMTGRPNTGETSVLPVSAMPQNTLSTPLCSTVSLTAHSALTRFTRMRLAAAGRNEAAARAISAVRSGSGETASPPFSLPPSASITAKHAPPVMSVASAVTEAAVRRPLIPFASKARLIKISSGSLIAALRKTGSRYAARAAAAEPNSAAASCRQTGGRADSSAAASRRIRRFIRRLSSRKISINTPPLTSSVGRPTLRLYPRARAGNVAPGARKTTKDGGKRRALFEKSRNFTHSLQNLYMNYIERSSQMA